jgi:hypothetical protein
MHTVQPVVPHRNVRSHCDRSAILTRRTSRSHGDLLVDMRVVGTQQQEIGCLGIQFDWGAIYVLNREYDTQRCTRLCGAGTNLYFDDKELIHTIRCRLCLGLRDRH